MKDKLVTTTYKYKVLPELRSTSTSPPETVTVFVEINESATSKLRRLIQQHVYAEKTLKTKLDGRVKQNYQLNNKIARLKHLPIIEEQTELDQNSTDNEEDDLISILSWDEEMDFREEDFDSGPSVSETEFIYKPESI